MTYDADQKHKDEQKQHAFFKVHFFAVKKKIMNVFSLPLTWYFSGFIALSDTSSRALQHNKYTVY